MTKILDGKEACPVVKSDLDIEVYDESGTEAVNLAAGASDTITITHTAMDIAGAPEVSIDNTSITIEVKDLRNDSFKVAVTNTDSVNAQSGTLSWSRKGCKIVIV